MPLDLTSFKPAPGAPEDATQIAGGFTATEQYINGNIELSGLKQSGATPGQVLVWNGTAWVAGAASTGGATVATTVAGLGAGSDGKQGLIRAGASPFNFVSVVYDATYGKWLSAPFTVYNVTNLAQNVTVYSDMAGFGAWFPWRVYDAAGLKPQFRWFAGFASNSTTTGYIQMTYSTVDLGAAPIASVAILGTEKTNSSNTSVMTDSGWIDITAGYSVKDYMRCSLQSKIIDNSKSVAVTSPAVLMRWVG